MNIYVGNLSYHTTEEQIRRAFEGYGEVTRVSLISDRNTGESRGFGFVEMADAEQARAAINGLNGSELDGRQLNVSEARPRPEGGGSQGRNRRDSW